MSQTYDDYLLGTKKILDQSQIELVPYLVTVCGRKYIVKPNVFSPKYFKDTELFAEHFPLQGMEEVLEIGPGTGAISITAAYKGAKKVLAIDINPDAVKNTEANIIKHDMQDKVEVRFGDVYDSLKPNEKFDIIFWNTPFGFVDEDEIIEDLEKAVFDPGYKSTTKFILDGKLHLKSGGKLLIGFSSTLGKLDLIKELCSKAGFESFTTIFKKESEEVHPVMFEIFEVK